MKRVRADLRATGSSKGRGNIRNDVKKKKTETKKEVSTREPVRKSYEKVCMRAGAIIELVLHLSRPRYYYIQLLALPKPHPV